MLTTVIIFLLTCIVMILSVLFFPSVKIGRLKFDTYWLVTLIGALIITLLGKASVNNIASSLFANTAVNPLKILVLFLCMTVLSIFLDELGFFRYIADLTLMKAGHSQKRLFVYLYLIVSILTVFTSNDIIILSFTPFICYFAKNAHIDPMPYLAAEFVAANTWSMALVIGNPTNIYLTVSYGISFFDYLSVMIIPTILSGIAAFIILYFMFKRKLSVKILTVPLHHDKISNSTFLTIGLIHLSVCTLTLAVGSYIGLEMWLVSLISLISLCITAGIAAAVIHRRPTELIKSIKRAPFALIPFVLSMFILVVALKEQGLTDIIASCFALGDGILSYGISSFLFANIINNIPMSVLFSTVIESAGTSCGIEAVYATVVGSNLGAFLTPIGALAGIMFSTILKSHGVKFSYLDFLKIGLTVAIPTLCTALFSLAVVL